MENGWVLPEKKIKLRQVTQVRAATTYHDRLAFKMNENISHDKLIDFVETAERNGIDFAKYTYICGAHNFIDANTVWDNDRIIKTFKFKSFYLDQSGLEASPCYVLSIRNKSYLMYELLKEITIWVCYTEEKYRKNGLMKKLLKRLTKMYPERKITIHTYNKSLKKTCTSLGINLFGRES